MSIRLEFRQGTAASAASNNPILGAGEPGYETDTGRWKIGDGSTRWNDLDYMGSAADVAAAQAAAQAASDSAAAAAAATVFTQSGTGAVARTIQDKARETVTDADFSTPANASAAAAALANYPYNLLNGDKGKKYRVLAGVIRQSGGPDTGWYFIDPINTGLHDKIGFNGTIAVDGNGDLVINYGFTAKNVLSLIAVPDEYFAQQGLKIGASVGTGSVTLEAYADLNAVITYSGMTSVGSMGLNDSVTASVDAANGIVTVTHPAVYNFGNTRATSVSVTPVDAVGTKQWGGDLYLSDVTSTGFKVHRVTPLAGVVSVTSGTPAITSLALGMSVAWDATNTCFVITHPATVSGDRAPVVSPMIRTPGSDVPYVYHAEFTSSGTEIRVHVYKATDGSKVTALDNSMRFSFVRPHTFLHRAISASDSHQFQVFRQNIPLNWSKIFANSGNIWLFGVMEID